MAFQILALSGGGYRGLYTAHILAEYEKQAGKPIARCFDLIAGTSIGGILALGLSLEIPAAAIRDKFLVRGQDIFSNRPRPKGKIANLIDFRNYFCRPKYDGRALRETIDEVVGPETLLGSAKHRVIVPSINMTKGAVQIFKTPHHRDFIRDHALKMTEIGLATSAAPTIFPLASIGHSLFVDGGLFANAPDFCALHEASHYLGIERGDIRILSIGTTTTGYSLSHAAGVDYGAFKWLVGGRLFSTMISAQQQMTEFMLQHLLGGNFFRVDQPQSHEQEDDLGLDIATEEAQATILGLAESSVQKTIVHPTLRLILANSAATAEFYYGVNRNSDP